MSNPKIRGKIYYLASPYSTPKRQFMPNFASLFVRHHIMQRMATKLIQKGYILIEPISMCYYKSLIWHLPQEYGYWQRRDRKFIKESDGVIVCNIPGWQRSVGVADEIFYATKLKKPVYLVDINKEGKIIFDRLVVI
jgi:hypothetical protein